MMVVGSTFNNMSNNKEEELVLSDLYDFVLNPNISTSERKTGLMAKKD